MKSENPSLQVERINRFYRPILKKNYENAEPRLKDMEYIGRLAVEYKSRSQFLSELVLDPPNATGDLANTSYKGDDYLTLSTIHSAKGCEWDVVYIIHAADGSLPSDLSTGTEKDIEEELRLTYVAMTRPKNFLYILWPLRFYNKPGGMSDYHRYNQCCRFFTSDVLETVEQKVISIDKLDNDIPDNSNISEDINTKIRDLWD
jgi:DNA helicase-2/ATP-dependent DNA helicase PcrA